MRDLLLRNGLFMKLFVSLFLTLVLSACQSTKQEVIEPTERSDEKIESTETVVPEGNVPEFVVDETETVQEDVDVEDYSNLWLKLANEFTFEVPENSRVAKQRDFYLSHPTYLEQVSKRAEPFLFLIIEQIEINNLPIELALLPVVESTFNPFAYSHAGASGLWQFMPASGDRFGLHQDWWYDGRRDVYASTRGALKYMEILHNYLGDDWLYAFAAYNSGEGRVKRAIAKNKKQNKPVDYWSLGLPKETENYVPKLLALIDILRHHEKYGVELPYIENKQVLTYVDTGSQIDLAYAAELAELTVSEIQQLNPAFNHWATSPEGPHKLLVPSSIADQFSLELAKIDEKDRISWDRYKVVAGDSLSVIAQQYQTTTNVLKQINNLNSSFIKIGQPLLIPIASKSQPISLHQQAARFKTGKGGDKLFYTVVKGDTLWGISRRHNVTIKQIENWNSFQAGQALYPGQKITLYSEVATAMQSVTYSVRSGDSLGRIANKFNVKTTDLVRWNGLPNGNYIKPGQKIKIYVNRSSV